MAKAFDVSLATTSLSLDDGRTGTATVTATNVTGRAVRARFKVQPQAPAQATWFTVPPAEGATATAAGADVERDMALGATEVYTVQVAVPADVAAGTYVTKFLVEAEDNTDEDFEVSPALSLEVKAAEEKPGLPKWVIPVAVLGIILLAGIIVGVIKMIGGDDEEVVAPPTTSVPTLVGLNVNEAVNALSAAGLGTNIDIVVVTTSAQHEQVLSQDPAPGTQVPGGTAVSLRVGGFRTSTTKVTLPFKDILELKELDRRIILRDVIEAGD